MSETQPPLPGRDATVTLREITRETLRPILHLDVAESQSDLVAPNSYSIAEAHFAPEAWFRAIYADETPVGFVMLYDKPEEPRYFLWRLMIDARYQRMGFGRRAVLQVVDYVQTRPNARELTVSHVPGKDSAAEFYQKLGFEYTGEEKHGELYMRLAL